jgi:hypothetical protein
MGRYFECFDVNSVKVLWFSSFFPSCPAFFKREPGIHQWALGRGQRRMSLASTEYKSKVR